MSKYLKDKRIELFNCVGKQDELGQHVHEYVSRGKFWAYTRLLSMDEYYQHGLDTHEEERLFIINYNKDLETSDRILYKEKEYKITRIDTFEDYLEDMNVYGREIKPRKIGK